METIALIDEHETATLAPRVGLMMRVITDVVTYKVIGAQNGGAFSMFETRTLPGQGTPPHVHSLDDESFYVLEGTYSFLVGDEHKQLGPGESMVARRGTIHAFENTGPAPARMLVLNSPAGPHERFFIEAGTEVTDDNPIAGEPDFGRLMAAAARAGIEILPPPAL